MVMYVEKDSVYCHQFDITKKISADKLKAATLHVIDESDLEVEKHLEGRVYDVLLAKLTELMQKLKDKQQNKIRVIRIAIDCIGSPFWGDFDPNQKQLYLFVKALKTVVQKLPCVAFISIPAHLYEGTTNERKSAAIRKLEHLVDAAICLDSFVGTNFLLGSNDHVNEIYKKEYNGLIHCPALFLGGLLQATRLTNLQKSCLAFKVRRKRFTIEQFSLPPEVEGESISSTSTRAMKGIGAGCKPGSGGNSELDF